MHINQMKFHVKWTLLYGIVVNLDECHRIFHSAWIIWICVLRGKADFRNHECEHLWQGDRKREREREAERLKSIIAFFPICIWYIRIQLASRIYAVLCNAAQESERKRLHMHNSLSPLYYSRKHTIIYFECTLHRQHDSHMARRAWAAAQWSLVVSEWAYYCCLGN